MVGLSFLCVLLVKINVFDSQSRNQETMNS